GLTALMLVLTCTMLAPCVQVACKCLCFKAASQVPLSCVLGQLYEQAYLVARRTTAATSCSRPEKRTIREQVGQIATFGRKLDETARGFTCWIKHLTEAATELYILWRETLRRPYRPVPAQPAAEDGPVRPA